jgi:hypothetical protein
VSRVPERALRLALVALVGAVSLLVPVTAATAGGDGAGQLDLPPSTRDELARMFDPALSKLGLRTTRATLQDLETYESSPTGTHLALYVEPIDVAGADDAFYLDRIASTSRIFLPKVFKRWSDVESFDVCMEPAENPSPAPPPVTQLLVVRKAAKKIDWKHADLAALLGEAAKRSERGDESGSRDSFFLYVSPRLRDANAYQEAAEDARLPSSSTTTRAGGA